MQLFGRGCGNFFPTELASFVLAPGQGTWSKDHNALLVPRLRLAPCVVRAVATGGTLFTALNGVGLLEVDFDWTQGQLDRSVFSFCWGSLEVFETGEPVAASTILLRGKIETPDLTVVGRYLKELRSREEIDGRVSNKNP